MTAALVFIGVELLCVAGILCSVIGLTDERRLQRKLTADAARERAARERDVAADIGDADPADADLADVIAAETETVPYAGAEVAGEIHVGHA